MTFSAGQRLVAADLNDMLSKINNPRIPLINQIGTSATTSGSVTETVVVTFPGATFTAHTAYRITFEGAMRGATSTSNTTMQFRDTNISGTVRGGPSGFNIGVITQNYAWNFDHYVANTSAADITSRILCATLQTSGGTAVIQGSATNPYSFVVVAVGLDTDWPQAIAL